MIIACDLVCWGSEHVPFNAGMLETILAAFPDEQLVFFGEQSHIELIQKQMGPETASNVSWTPLRIPERSATYLKRVQSEIKTLNDIFRVLAPGSDHRIVFLTYKSATLTALKLSKRHLPERIPVQVVLHGGLTGIGQKRSLRPLRRLKDTRTAITLLGRRHIQYVVLEENIREVILRELPFLSGRVEVFEHPSIFNETASESIPLKYPIRFGFLGLANRQKGFPTFVELATETVRKHGDRVEFHALGMSSNSVKSLPGINALASKPMARHLSQHDYMKGLKQVHFTIFPYNPAYYALCPSGTLLDAIAWGKPIIAARIPLFENLFKRYGDLGYLFSTEAELRQIADTIVDHLDPTLYDNQVLNLRKARADRTPTALAPAYRAICERARNLPENRATHGPKTSFSFFFHRKEE